MAGDGNPNSVTDAGVGAMPRLRTTYHGVEYGPRCRLERPHQLW